MRSNEQVMSIYDQGQRAFAENRVQNLMEKQVVLSKDIEWHIIGNLQTNKIKYIAPFISLIHSLDDWDLWKEIDKQAKKNNRIIPCLLQIKIAQEDTKSGFEWDELQRSLQEGLQDQYNHVAINGVMGMASLTEDETQIKTEFGTLKSHFDNLKQNYFPKAAFNEISMGMSSDYKIAIDYGSTMIRVGSAVFE